MRANLGFTAWNCFHQGISLTTGVTIGMANTLVGMVILCADLALHERIGIGSICNMLLIGPFTDLIIAWDVLPTMQTWYTGVGMMIIGMFVVAFGTCFYISSQFGAGPRDSLMVALARRTGLKPGWCRIGIETTVTVIGWFLGGPVGVGTLIGAFGQGTCLQGVFQLMHFKPTEIHHENFRELWHNLKGVCEK
ncbi:YczE/YyaS/YitT family protein [Acidaminobacterium chupaoyuni]